MLIEDVGMGVAHVIANHHRDDRGVLAETFRADLLCDAGWPLHTWTQGNLSANLNRVFRGVHFSTAKQGQAKYVTCVDGSMYDYAVDLREGSPTFGRTATVRLVSGESVYVPAGFGHGFATVQDRTIVTYLLSSVHDPDMEHTISPIGLFAPLAQIISHHGVGKMIQSERDKKAPALPAYMEAGGQLPRYRDQ